MKVAVVVFPGTNCDHDAEHVFGTQLGCAVTPVWHRSTDLGGADLVVLPGGFSYGDYLRTGALAKLSPVMAAVKKHAQGGGRVLGICNGFQILCESGLLPGALLENVGRVFLSQFVHLSVGSTNSFFTKRMKLGDVISCPIAHFQGNYFADGDTLKNLEVKQRVVFRYCDSAGVVEHDDRLINVNGSAHSIAGVCSEDGNVVGMMPHPERATELLTGYIGGESGLSPFASTTANS